MSLKLTGGQSEEDDDRAVEAEHVGIGKLADANMFRLNRAIVVFLGLAAG